MRFVLSVLAAFSLAACAGPEKEQPQAEGTPRTLPDKPSAKNIGVLVFDDVFITEVTAPLDVYHHVPADKRNVFTVAPTMAKIMTYEHVIIQPDFSFENAPKIDILVVPSGNGSLTTDLDNTALIDFVKKRAETAEWVTSHCWGAFTLGKAGLLNGKNATTFPGYENQLKEKFPQVNIVTTARYVEDGKIITSNGGLAAYEAATYASRKVFGDTDATTIQSGLVYAPDNIKFSSNPAK